MKIRLVGREGSGGQGEGIALISHEPFYFGIDENGVVNQQGHELYGKNIKDKVVVFPCGCGPVGSRLFNIKKKGLNPKAIVNMTPYYHLVADAIFADIPIIYGFDRNVLEVISNGDRVVVDVDEKIITIYKKQ